MYAQTVQSEETADARSGSRSAALQTIIAKSCTGTEKPSVGHEKFTTSMGMGVNSATSRPTTALSLFWFLTSFEARV